MPNRRHLRLFGAALALVLAGASAASEVGPPPQDPAARATWVIERREEIRRQHDERRRTPASARATARALERAERRAQRPLPAAVAIPSGDPVGAACPRRETCALRFDPPAGKAVVITAVWSAQTVRCDDATSATPAGGDPIHPWWRCRRALYVSGPGAGYTAVLVDE
jgi:hypothetical protein